MVVSCPSVVDDFKLPDCCAAQRRIKIRRGAKRYFVKMNNGTQWTLISSAKSYDMLLRFINKKHRQLQIEMYGEADLPRYTMNDIEELSANDSEYYYTW